MKKLCLMLCVLALCLPLCAAGAEPDATLTVRLGDGAPIPYFEGFESQIVSGAEAVAGITGAADAEWGDSACAFRLQNLALTDDALALFYTQTYEKPIVYEGDTQYARNQKVQPPHAETGDGAQTLVNPVFREGHPLDERTLACMVVYALDEPLADHQTLRLSPRFNDALNAYEGGIVLTLDRSQAQDPSVTCTPGLEVRQSLALFADEPAVDFDYIIERVAFTPFGNRCLLNFRATGPRNAFFGYRLLDDQGRALPSFSTMGTYVDSATEEHPVWVRNEQWFFGGEGTSALTLAPLGKETVRNPDWRQVAVPLASLPTDVSLEGGGTLHIERCDVGPDGFYLTYDPQAHNGYLSFDLAGADGQSLGLDFIGYDLHDPVRSLLGAGGYWTEAYEGRVVSRVSAEALAQVSSLLVGYGAGSVELLMEQALTIPIQ